MTTTAELPIVDACYVSSAPNAGYVMAREAHEPLEASRRLPITKMIDGEGDDTTDPDEAAVVIFGSDAFGWGVYELETAEPEAVQ